MVGNMEWLIRKLLWRMTIKLRIQEEGSDAENRGEMDRQRGENRQMDPS